MQEFFETVFSCIKYLNIFLFDCNMFYQNNHFNTNNRLIQFKQFSFFVSYNLHDTYIIIAFFCGFYLFKLDFYANYDFLCHFCSIGKSTNSFVKSFDTNVVNNTIFSLEQFNYLTILSLEYSYLYAVITIMSISKIKQ